MLANLSRNLAIGVKWVLRHSQPAGRPDGSWTHGLSGAVEQATPVAAGYSHFEVCFQAFHQDRIAVDADRKTSLAGVWAGGDCVAGGEDLTVSAVQDGKLAALSIDRFLKGGA